MDPFFRWVARHQKSVRTALALLLGTVLGFLRIWLEMPIVLVIGLILWGAVLVSAAVTYSYTRFQKRAMAAMTDRCDPYPFLQEMQTQLSYGLPLLQDTMLRVNLAMALHNTGATQTALDVMQHIPIDQKRAAIPMMKCVYYNNLACFRMELGDIAGAEDAYRRFRELSDGKARRAFEKHYPNTVSFAEAEHLYRLGDYASALNAIQKTQPPTASSKVEAALFRAKCAIALGDHAAARQDLGYVIDHGNRLAAVDQARKLLDTL